MDILLDTCAFLWLITDDPQLSRQARDTFSNPKNMIYLSSVSSWEIVIKYSLEKLPLPEAPSKYIPSQRKKHFIQPLSLLEEATYIWSRLPFYHKDPFDRMLICQSIYHGLHILTSDPLVSQYPIRTIW